MVQFRHPEELGGIYWIVSVGIAILSCFSAVQVYFETKKDTTAASVYNPDILGDVVATKNDTEWGRLEENEVWSFVWLMSVGWLIVFGAFLLTMKKKYRRTIWSTQTGAQLARSFFLERTSEEIMHWTLHSNKKHWENIRDEIKQWVVENWWKWQEEKPDWFTDNWIAKVPDDMIPAEALRELKMAGGGKRRRSSLAELLEGKSEGKESDDVHNRARRGLGGSVKVIMSVFAGDEKKTEAREGTKVEPLM